MSAIGPGDWVECIDTYPGNPPSIRPGRTAYATGEVCLVEEVGVDADGPWLNCVGKVRPRDYDAPGNDYDGWEACWFRPIYRPKADLIQSLMQPVDGVKPSCVPA